MITARDTGGLLFFGDPMTERRYRCYVDATITAIDWPVDFPPKIQCIVDSWTGETLLSPPLGNCLLHGRDGCDKIQWLRSGHAFAVARHLIAWLANLKPSELAHGDQTKDPSAFALRGQLLLPDVVWTVAEHLVEESYARRLAGLAFWEPWPPEKLAAHLWPITSPGEK